ncbi:fungal specific transcription factor domain-containing protein [Colletotrichum nymphaeae SA-01]|uniref:Fungal specific transcription factor domain-containing protein n=1 Tax=Colletotrichum nymphaeae SA-01 TaxID=1460502 RepID=A0A135TTA4_9PEZI|nr:fungal specific transcription factor domain-containing protein [Colletotrichum nymphaeae SA-01]
MEINLNGQTKKSSRNSHPCDFCRYKRAACLVHEDTPPCELCRRLGKECTFVGGPNKRRRLSERRQSGSSDGIRSPHRQQDGAASGADGRFPSAEVSPIADSIFVRGLMDSASPISPHTTSSPDVPRRENVFVPSSLDAEPGHNAQVIGLSGESDPYLLNLYHFDERDECTFQQLRIRNMGPEDGVPIQFMLQRNSQASKAQPGGLGATAADLRCEVSDLISENVGQRLITLFWKYVQPYFPVVSKEHTIQNLNGSPSAMPICLLAAIYGHALPFCVFDDILCVDVDTLPSADHLFKLAWMAALSEFHTPSLATVQTMLLMIQRRPTNKHVADTPFKWTMLADTVALAQCLGLNLDPSDWANFGRSSHIQECDWDVSPLGPDDFGDVPGCEGEGPLVCRHFLHLASLTEIVSKIQQNMFSIKSTRALSKSLEATFEVARPLRIELAEWLQMRPDVGEQPAASLPECGLDGNGSLKLAYITAKIAVFKALLRPKSIEVPAEARTALRTGSMAIAREMHDFLAKLEAHHLEAFWHSYSRVNFAIASNFIVLLFALSPTLSEAEDAIALLIQWRGLLRIKSRSCDLLNLSLLRLDAIFVAGLGKLIELTPAAAEAASNRGL